MLSRAPVSETNLDDQQGIFFYCLNSIYIAPVQVTCSLALHKTLPEKFGLQILFEDRQSLTASHRLVQFIPQSATQDWECPPPTSLKSVPWHNDAT